MNAENEDENAFERDRLKRLIAERDEHISGLSPEEKELFSKFKKDFSEKSRTGNFDDEEADETNENKNPDSDKPNPDDVS